MPHVHTHSIPMLYSFLATTLCLVDMINGGSPENEMRICQSDWLAAIQFKMFCIVSKIEHSIFHSCASVLFFTRTWSCRRSQTLKSPVRSTSLSLGCDRKAFNSIQVCRTVNSCLMLATFLYLSMSLKSNVILHSQTLDQYKVPIALGEIFCFF